MHSSAGPGYFLPDRVQTCCAGNLPSVYFNIRDLQFQHPANKTCPARKIAVQARALVFFALQANGNLYHRFIAFPGAAILFNIHRIKDPDGFFEHHIFFLQHPDIYHKRSKVWIA